MNIAMTIYSKYFHDNKSENRLGQTEIIAIKECKDHFLQHGNKVYKFIDNSQLIFTYDNIQVSLF
jgi:hypothetical protein